MLIKQTPKYFTALLSLIFMTAICEESLASGTQCASIHREDLTSDFKIQSLAEKIQTLKQLVVRRQGEISAEKNALLASHSIDPTIAQILENGTKGYATGSLQVPGLPDFRVTNAQIVEQVTLDLNNSGSWKQKISKGEVESILYIGSTVHSGIADTSYISLILQYQGLHKGESPDMTLVNSANQLYRKSSDLQKMKYVIEKSTSTAETKLARDFRTSQEAENALVDLAMRTIEMAGIPKTLLKPYLDLTTKYAYEGGPYAQNKSTYDDIINLLKASLNKSEISQEIYEDLKSNLWMYGQLPGQLFDTYKQKASNRFIRAGESELRNIIQILKEVESLQGITLLLSN